MKPGRSSLPLLATSLLLWAASPALAAGAGSAGTPPLFGVAGDEATTVARGDGEKPFLRVGGTLLYENSLGIGTFVADEYLRRPYWEMLWSLRAKLYLFHELLSIQARLDLVQPVIDNADAETNENNQFTVSDTFLTILAPAFYQEPVTGIRFGAWTDLVFPSSLESRFARLLVGWRLGVIVSRDFPIAAIRGSVDLTFQLRFTKNFHERKTPLSRGEYIESYRLRDAVGVSTDYGVMSRLTVTLTFLEDFYAALDFAVYNDWHYDTSGAVPCPEELERIGQGCAGSTSAPAARPGRGRVDLTLSSLELGYTPLPWLTIALGVTTYQPPFDDDNRGLRPPLNFQDASRNFTSLYLDVIGTY